MIPSSVGQQSKGVGGAGALAEGGHGRTGTQPWYCHGFPILPSAQQEDSIRSFHIPFHTALQELMTEWHITEMRGLKGASPDFGELMQVMLRRHLVSEQLTSHRMTAALLW